MLKQSWLYVETMLIMFVDFSFQHWKIQDVEKVKSDSKCWKSVELVLKKKENKKYSFSNFISQENVEKRWKEVESSWINAQIETK